MLGPRRRRPLKVLFVGGSFAPYGAPRVQASLLRNIDRTLFEPTVYFLRDEGADEEQLLPGFDVQFGAEAHQRVRNRVPYLLRDLIGLARSNDVVVSMLEGPPLYLSCLAATLTSVTGSVQTNRGNGFVATPAPTFLKAGDQVMAGEKSSGVIAYDNGCTVEVKAGQVVTVTDDAACKAANLNTGSTAAAGSAPIGVGAIAVGAAAIGGAAIVLSNKKSSSSP